MNSIIWQIFNLLCLLAVCSVSIYLIALLIKAIKIYFATSERRSEKEIIKKSLGEVIKEYRVNRNMTQEFVAEYLGVSRQAVSKWESGASDPSTSNLLALVKLFGISAEELLNKVKSE